MKLNVNVKELRETNAPVYFRHVTSDKPQPAYIEIYPMDQSVMYANSMELGGIKALPAGVLHGRVIQISIDPYITGQQLADILTDPLCAEYVDRICAGYGTKWTGENVIGTYTADAEQALNELSSWVSHIDGNLTVWDVADYMDLWSAPENATDDDIDQAADGVMDNLEANELIEGGKGAVIKYIKDRLSK